MGTDQKQVKELMARTLKLVDHWCPEAFHDEPIEQRIWRAFMHATACLADQQRALYGFYPVIPLESQPDPMVGYDSDQDIIQQINEIKELNKVHPLTVYRMRHLLDLAHSRLMVFQVMSEDSKKHGNIPFQHDLLKPIGEALGFPFKEKV